jgi:transcriptional regulator with XRE-family HTH domain
MAARRISDQLRDAIESSGKSRYRIAKDTGISQAILSRFVNTQCGLSLDYIDRLADYLGLELKHKGRQTKRK